MYTCSPALIPDCCEDAIIKSPIPSFYVVCWEASPTPYPENKFCPRQIMTMIKTQKNKYIKALRAENSGKKKSIAAGRKKCAALVHMRNFCLRKCLRQRPYGSCANSCSFRSCSSRSFSAAIRLSSTSWMIWLCSFSE